MRPPPEPVDSGLIRLGHITGASGLRGWVKVHSDTDPRENIVTYKEWLLHRGGQWTPVAVLQGRPQGKTIVAQLEGVGSRETAELMVGIPIAIARDSLPAAAAGEYYWADLIGLQVETIEGVALGTVLRLMETGANDVLVVNDGRDGKSGEILIPWVLPDVVTEVDIPAGRIAVDWDPDF